MKISLVLAVLIFVSALNAGASVKTCTGSSDNIDSKGLVLELHASTHEIVIKAVRGGSFAGTYVSNHSKSVKTDGKTYLNYEGQEEDYFNEMAMDQELLKPNTVGQLKIRSISEGYFDTVYTCVDARQ